ncbi:hypothetical protein ACW9HF_15050 [Nocardia gipuzkoensis]
MSSMRYREPGIEIHSLDAITDEYGGSNDSWWGMANLHVKAQDGDAPYLVANELICCRLAAALGLPVLPGEVAYLPDGRKCWATPQLRHGGAGLPPTRQTEILSVYGSTVAGALVFDCWVQNDDRHEDNFLFHPRLGMWLIDHEHSLAGRSGEHFGATTNLTPLRYHGFGAAPLSSDDLQYWIRRVRSTPVAVIELALQEAYERGLLVPKPRVKSLRSLLIDRQGKIESLVSALRKNEKPASSGPSLKLFSTEGGR